MKCTIPEISWHNRNPVLSIHVQPVSEKFYRLATGGSDCHVLIWQLIVNELGAVKTEALSDLTRHHRAVNSVRWSPSGQHLATADDDANIIIWQLKTDNIPLLEGETNDKETWTVYKVLRGHKEDIYDLCWSANGLKLFSGSVDNTAILWDFTKGKSDEILTDHKGFVQGVAWDPKGYYLATISTDRVCRIYDSTGKIKSRIHKGCLPVPEDHYLHNKEVKFFHDDTFKSFFRRLDFSPDGTLLAVPSGRIETEDCKKVLNAALIFAVDSWTGPVALLPSGKQCSTVVRFCPVLFEKHENGPEAAISLPYRMIIAVGTERDVILYDTQQIEPFAYFKDINYTRLTDLSWSDDGRLLIASSSDGFCALINFEVDELGVQYVKEESENEESVLDVSGCEELDKEETVEVKPKKLSLLEQWTVKTPKKGQDVNLKDTSKRKREESKNGCKRITPVPVEDKKSTDTPPSKKIKTIPVEDKKSTDTPPSKKIKPILVEDKKTTNTPPSKKIKPIPVEDKKNTGTPLSKKIKPIPVEDKTETPPTKRIKPILVTDKDKDPVSTSKKDPPKVSPLLNFLKKATKKSEDPKPKVTSVDLTLDELEARDSWTCEKQPVNVIESADIDEYTEEFSLHLEDTSSRQSSVNTKDENEKIPEISTTKIVHNSETNIENLKDRIEEKGNIPKRRIPLITLSSPKQKKK